MAEVTASKGRYTPDEAVERYLALLKDANPSKEARAIIVEIEHSRKLPRRLKKQTRRRAFK